MALNLFIMGLNFALSFLEANVKNETNYQWALFKKQLSKNIYLFLIIKF